MRKKEKEKERKKKNKVDKNQAHKKLCITRRFSETGVFYFTG